MLSYLQFANEALFCLQRNCWVITALFAVNISCFANFAGYVMAHYYDA